VRKREDILKELEAVKSEAAREAQFGNAPQLAMQAGINAPLIATALGSLLEVALDIRDLVDESREDLHIMQGDLTHQGLIHTNLVWVRKFLESTLNQHVIEHTRLLGKMWDMARQFGVALAAISEQIDDAAGLVTVDKGEEPQEEVPVIHISNEERIAELLAENKLKGFEEKCNKCGTPMKVIKQDEKSIELECPKCKRWVEREVEQVCNKCGAILEKCTDGLFCPKCDADPEA